MQEVAPVKRRQSLLDRFGAGLSSCKSPGNEECRQLFHRVSGSGQDEFRYGVPRVRQPLVSRQSWLALFDRPTIQTSNRFCAVTLHAANAIGWSDNSKQQAMPSASLVRPGRTALSSEPIIQNNRLILLGCVLLLRFDLLSSSTIVLVPIVLVEQIRMCAFSRPPFDKILIV